MKLVVTNRRGELLGTAYTDETGRAVLTDLMKSWEGEVLPSGPNRTVTQADGDRFIAVLRREFRTPYVIATLELTDEERRARARRFCWEPGDIVWLTPPGPRCPRCRSHFVVRIVYGLPVTEPLNAVTGGCQPRPENAACTVCGHRFKRRERPRGHPRPPRGRAG